MNTPAPPVMMTEEECEWLPYVKAFSAMHNKKEMNALTNEHECRTHLGRAIVVIDRLSHTQAETTETLQGDAQGSAAQAPRQSGEDLLSMPPVEPAQAETAGGVSEKKLRRWLYDNTPLVSDACRTVAADLMASFPALSPARAAMPGRLVVPRFSYGDDITSIHWSGPTGGVLILVGQDGVSSYSIKTSDTHYSTNCVEFNAADGLPKEAADAILALGTAVQRDAP